MSTKETFIVSVIGLGRIGLPHSLVSAHFGNSVFGIESNQEVISSLKNSKPSFREEGISELLLENLGSRFFVVDDLSFVKKSDVVIVAIGINYVNGERRANLAPLIELCDNISPYLEGGKLLVFRTTMPIGTTDMLTARLEGRTGLKEGRDFHVVFCPERLVEGHAIQEEMTLPKIIGAYSDQGFELARQYFEKIGGGEIIRSSNPRAAELTKLVDNSWRQLSFSFSNDLALLCENLNLDVLEVIQSANKGYKRNNIQPPSCGVSGYCLTKDPYLLEDSFEEIAKERGFNSVWYYGRRANDYITTRTYHKVIELYKKYKQDSRPVRILVAGLAFKEDTDDFRFSHGVNLIKMLSAHKEFEVKAFDPFLNENTSSNNPYVSIVNYEENVTRNDQSTLVSSKNFLDCVSEQDVVVFTVKHREFVELAENGGTQAMVEKMRKPAIIIDGWNIFANNELLHSNLPEVSPSFVYRGIGRGNAIR